jgi:hypothetical protein
MDTWLLIALLCFIAYYVVDTNKKIRKILETMPRHRPLEEGGMSLYDLNKIRRGLLHLLERFPEYSNNDDMLDAVAKFLDIHLRKWEIEKYGDISLREYLKRHG